MGHWFPHEGARSWMRYDLRPRLIMTYCERVGVLPSVVCRFANRSAFIIIRAWIGLGHFYRRGQPWTAQHASGAGRPACR